MDVLIRGTTPTIIFAYSKVDVVSIEQAYLIIKQLDDVVIEKPKTEADVLEEDQAISWTLTQEETFRLSSQLPALVCCDWKLQDGTRGRSETLSCIVEDSGKDEVI